MHYVWIAGIPRADLLRVMGEGDVAPYLHRNPLINSVIHSCVPKVLAHFPMLIKHPLTDHYMVEDFVPDDGAVVDNLHVELPLVQYYNFSQTDDHRVRVRTSAGQRCNYHGYSIGNTFSGIETDHIILSRLLAMKDGQLILGHPAFSNRCQTPMDDASLVTETSEVADILSEALYEMVEEGQWGVSFELAQKYFNTCQTHRRARMIMDSEGSVRAAWENYVLQKESLVSLMATNRVSLSNEFISAMNVLKRWQYAESTHLISEGENGFRWRMKTVPLKFGRRTTSITLQKRDTFQVLLSNRSMAPQETETWRQIASYASEEMSRKSARMLCRSLEKLTLEDFQCQEKVGKREILE